MNTNTTCNLFLVVYGVHKSILIYIQATCVIKVQLTDGQDYYTVSIIFRGRHNKTADL